MNRLLLGTMCLLALAALLVPAGVLADRATITIWPGENWISAPLVPFNPSPTSVFAGIDINGKLQRLDASTGQLITYDAAHPNIFGSILLGEGYILSSSASGATSVTYEGVPDGVPDPGGVMADMWISLPGLQNDGANAGGMHWIGNPFNHTVGIQACRVTDGVMLLSLQEAVNRHWIDGVWATRDNHAQAGRTAGLPSLSPDDTVLRAGSMYQITTHVDNLALIIAPEVPEPCSMLALACGLGPLAIRKRRR